MLPLWGFGVRIMRQTIKGELPSLPGWDNWGELFGDGLRFFVVGLVYGLPVWLPLCCSFAMWMLAVGPVILVEQAQVPEIVGVGGMFIIYGLGFVLMGVASILGLFLGFLSFVAQTRWVAQDSLGSAFEFGEVWRLARAGFSNYLLAFAVWYGALFLGSMVASMLMYTIVLACLYPFLFAVLVAYSPVLMGALYGIAYYHTQAGLPSGEGEQQPA